MVVKDRLSKADWLQCGLETLAKDGAHALKVGSMAARLSVSRGSFYWHFADLADFRSQLLQSWQERTTDRVIRTVEAEALPDRLNHLLQRAFAIGSEGQTVIDSVTSSAESAIRSWATTDADVAIIVATADTRRVDYIAGLLTAVGVAEDQALSRAAFIYCAYLGRSLVIDVGHATLDAPALDDIGALMETWSFKI